jgi:hypothetical protein
VKLDQVVLRIEVDLRDGPNFLELRIHKGADQRRESHVFDITNDSPPVWRLQRCGGG